MPPSPRKACTEYFPTFRLSCAMSLALLPMAEKGGGPRSTRWSPHQFNAIAYRHSVGHTFRAGEEDGHDLALLIKDRATTVALAGGIDGHLVDVAIHTEPGAGFDFRLPFRSNQPPDIAMAQGDDWNSRHSPFADLVLLFDLGYIGQRFCGIAEDSDRPTLHDRVVVVVVFRLRQRLGGLDLDHCHVMRIGPSHQSGGNAVAGVLKSNVHIIDFTFQPPL